MLKAVCIRLNKCSAVNCRISLGIPERPHLRQPTLNSVKRQQVGDKLSLLVTKYSVKSSRLKSQTQRCVWNMLLVVENRASHSGS